ncbi:hypothetical protein DERF_002124 [Dermatophagoides farinae]|uniref:Uncharacterized protein n=1 Tax=Dermatophagoides farinae TaxID=6954 RepID=A0A922IBT8_DERFA|nr:hypothetical protein DERF_002124 [Dermatophagoides farinae]
MKKEKVKKNLPLYIFNFRTFNGTIQSCIPIDFCCVHHYIILTFKTYYCFQRNKKKLGEINFYTGTAFKVIDDLDLEWNRLHLKIMEKFLFG